MNTIKKVLFLGCAFALSLGALATEKTVKWSLPSDWSDAIHGVGEVGSPDLPAFRHTVTMPKGSVLKGVTFEAEWSEVEGVPSPVAAPVTSGQKLVYPEPGPKFNEVYPASAAYALEAMISGNKILQPIVITPYKWDGTTKTLYKATKLDVEIRYEVEDSSSLKSKSKSGLKLTTSSVETEGEVLILSPHNFVSLWHGYAAFRKSTDAGKNFTFTVVDTSTIYADTTNYMTREGDYALALHHYIEKAFYKSASCDKQYVILGAAPKKGSVAFNPDTMIPTREFLNNNPLGEWVQTGDMYYGCMDRLNNGQPDPDVEVWDYQNDGVYMGAGTSGSYTTDPNNCIDWTMEIAVTRVPLLARSVEKLGSSTIEVTASDMMNVFTNRLAWAESAEFANTDRGRSFLGGDENENISRGDKGDYSLEHTFFDGILNMFDAKHCNPSGSSEWGPRSRVYNITSKIQPSRDAKIIAMNISNTTKDAAYAASGDLVNFYQHGMPREYGLISAPLAYQGGGFYSVYASCFSCHAGKYGFDDGGAGITNALCFGEAPIVAPNAHWGALVTATSTGMGWSGGFDSISLAMDRYLLNALYGNGVNNGVPMNAGQACKYMHNNCGLVGAGAAQGGCNAKVVVHGDPLIKVYMMPNRTELMGYSRNLSVSTASSKTFNIADDVAAARAAFSDADNQTLTIEGAGKFRTTDTLTVTNVANLVWNVAGGAGRNGITFSGTKGNLTLGGTATRYFGPKLTNVGKVSVTGGNVTLDFDTTACGFDELEFVGGGQGADRPTNNVLRTRKEGFIPAAQTIPVVNSALKLQTINVGGNTAALKETPLFYVTNGVLTVESNPYWGTEYFVRPTYLSNAKLLGEYADFGLGRSDSNGYDLYVDGTSEIGGSTPIKVTGELRLHLEDAETTLTITNALANGHNGAAGSVVVSGAGKVILATSPTLTGGMTIESGVALELPKIPLTSGGTITLESGAKLLLPEPSSSGIYNVYSGDAKLVLGSGVKVYKASAPSTEIKGRFVNGNFIPDDAVIYWKAASGTWQNSSTTKTCWTNSNGTAVGFTNGQSVFFGPVASSVSVTSSGVTADYVEINAPGKTYTFNSSSITPNLLSIMSDVTFNAPITNAKRVSVAGGTTTLPDSANTSSAKVFEVADGGSLKMMTSSSKLSAVSRSIRAIRFSFSAAKGDSDKVAIQELRLFNDSTRFMLPQNTIIEDIAGQKIRIDGTSGDAHTFTWLSETPATPNESLKALIDGIVEGGNKWWADKNNKPTWFTITFPSEVTVNGYNLRTADHAPRNPKSWTVEVSEDGVNFEVERTVSDLAFDSTHSWLSGDGSAKAYYLVSSGSKLRIRNGGTVYAAGIANLDVVFDEGSTIRLTGDKSKSLYRPSSDYAKLCTLTLPENGGVYVSAQGVSASADSHEVLWGYGLTESDKAKFTPADNVTLSISGGALYATVDSTRCGPFVGTITSTKGATPSWTTLAWTDRYGDAIAWNDSLQYSASATATLKVESLPANGATFDVNYTPTLATMKLVGGSTEPLTLKWTVASVGTIDLSEYAGRVILQPNGNIASTVTIIVGADTVLDAMCEASFTIDAGKQLTVTSGTIQETKVTNNGTLNFEGGTSANPIIYNANGGNNSNLGVFTLAAGAYLKITPNNNKTFNITGAGAASSTVEMYKTSGQGMSSGTVFRNLTLISNITGNNQLWLEQANCVDATVDLKAQGQVKLNNVDSTIGSLLGSSTVAQQQSGRRLTITPTANADYSGASSVAFTIAASEFTQTLSGNYTGALTVDVGGKVALGASAHPSSIVNSGMVTVAGDQLTCALTLNSGATINVTTPGEPTADSYAITSGTFTNNGGTVRINGKELGSQWHIENGRIVRSQAEQYGPLMSEHWHQHNPFNWFAAYVGGDLTPCGCVAMGVGQMFHYYRWPVRTDTVTEAATTYQTGGNVTQFPLAVNGKNPFLWDEMRDYASACTLTGQYESARMILWCDALAKMCFQPGGSNTALYYVPESVSYWYEKGEELLPSAGDHRERLKTELAAGRPIQTTIDGHQVVIDGWRSSDNKFHVNWGQEDTDSSKTTWYDVTQSTLGSWSVSSFWVGITPRKMVQIQTLPKLGLSTVTLAWDVPAVHTNSITGFTVKDYTCADAVTNYTIPGTNELSYTRADYYPIPGVYGATENATFSCTVYSSNTKALVLDVQVRYDGGPWQTFATPELSTEESYEDKGVYVDKTKSITVNLNLGEHAGKAAEFRIKTTRTGNSFAADYTGPFLRLCNCSWTNVHAPVTAVAHAAGATARSLEISGLTAGSYHSFTVTPTIEGAVESEPMGMRVAAANQEIPALPEILRIETMGSPITDGFVREVKPGAMVFFVKGSETVTGVSAAISHPGLVAANLVRVKPIPQGNWYAIEIDASEQITVNSRMILTIEATDAYENRAVKDLMLIVSNTIEDDNDGQLMSALDQENAVIVPPDVTNNLESTFDYPLVGAGTVVFNNTLPEGTTLISSLQNSFAWHGTVRMVDCPTVEYKQKYKNDNSTLIEESSPTPPGPTEPEILQSAYLWLDASEASTITETDGKVTNWASRNSGGKAATSYTQSTQVTAGPTVLTSALAGKNVVDFGDARSHKDLKFDESTTIRTIFMVAAVATDGNNIFFLGDNNTGSKTYHFHRGNNGTYFNGTHASKFTGTGGTRRNGEAVTNPTSAVVPTSYGLYTLTASSDATANCICQDRDQADRNGGKKVAELIIFNKTLTNDERDEIESYLMNKWLTEAPTPENSLGFDNAKETASTVLGGAALTGTSEWATSPTYTKVRGSDSNYAATINSASGTSRMAPYGQLTAMKARSWSVHASMKLAEVNTGILFGISADAVWRTTGVANYIALEYVGNNQVRVVKGKGKTFSKDELIAPTTVANATTAYHSYLLTYTYGDSPYCTLYVDGVKIADSAAMTAVTDYQWWCVGGIYGGPDSISSVIMNGAQVDDFAIWTSTALTATQAADLASKFPTWPGPTPTNAAKIGDTEYATVAEAIEAVTTGQTITLLKNCSEASLSAGDKTFTLDLASYSLTGTLTIGASGAVTLTTLPAADTLKIAGSGRLVYNNATIPTLNNIWDSSWTGTFVYGGCNTSKTNWDLTSYYNGANSKFEFNGMLTGGYFDKQNWSLGDFIVNGSVTFDNGYSTISTGVETVYTFKALKGTGSITTNISKVRAALRFDTMDDFTGSISLTGYRVVVGTSEFTIAEADPANSTITLLDRANLTASTLTATAGIVVKTAVGGSTTLASNATFGDGAEIDARNGVLTANGTLTFGATTKVRVATAPAGDTQIISKSGTTAGDISTTVSVYVGESTTAETRDYSIKYKTDGVYLIPGESPYAKFANNPAVLTYNGAGTFHTAYFVLFDTVGGTNTTTTYNGNASSGTIIPGQTAVIDKSWKVFSANANTDNGKYVAPGYVLRFASGIGTAQAMDADFDPLSIGGMVVESGATGWSFVSNKGNAARATQLGDNRATGGVPTWFVFNESFEFDRYSSGYKSLNTLTLWGEINFEIAEGKTVSLNNDTTKGCPNPVLDTTTHACLKMHGAGTLAANLNATGAVTLDYTDIPLSRETAYISGTLTINDATVIKLPDGLAENTPFKMATTLSGANNGDRTIWIGETQVTKNVTFANGAISYSSTIEYKTLGWNGSAWTNAQGVATAVDGTSILNAKNGDVITFASNVTPHQFIVPENATVTITGENKMLGPITGSGTLAYHPGAGQQNVTIIAADKLTEFTGTLWLKSGRHNYSTALADAITVKVTDGAQVWPTGGTWNNHFVLSGQGWKADAGGNVVEHTALRMSSAATLSASSRITVSTVDEKVTKIGSTDGCTYNGALEGDDVTFVGSGSLVINDMSKCGNITGDIVYEMSGTLQLGNNNATAGTKYSFGKSLSIASGKTLKMKLGTAGAYDHVETEYLWLDTELILNGCTVTSDDGGYRYTKLNVLGDSTFNNAWNKHHFFGTVTGSNAATLTLTAGGTSLYAFESGDFPGTVKVTSDNVHLRPEGTALAKATLDMQNGDIVIRNDTTIGSVGTCARSISGTGTLTLKGGTVSGDITGTMGVVIDGEVALSGGMTYTGTTTIFDTGILAMVSDTQRTLKALAFELGGVLIVNTNDTQAAVAVTDAVDLQNGAIRLAGVLPAEGGTVKLLSATGGILNYENALEGRGDWTLNYADNTLTATKAKATYVTPGENGSVTNAGNNADSLDISLTLAKKATKGTDKEVTDKSTSAEITDALNQDGANGYKVWENAVLGLSSTNANDQLVIKPIQTSNAKKVTLKVPEVNVDTTTGADVTFSFWSKTSDTDWTEVPGGAVESGESKELELPETGVKYYQLRTTIKTSKQAAVPTVIPSANIVASGMPLTTGTGSTQYAASLGTKTLEDATDYLQVELAGAGVYEGQEYHLEITEPETPEIKAGALKLTTSSVDDNASGSHFAIVAKATAQKTVLFNFGRTVNAGTTCKLTLLSAGGAPTGDVRIASDGVTGAQPAIVTAIVADTPVKDGLAESGFNSEYRIPSLVSDGAGEVICCYDVRYGATDLGYYYQSIPAGGIDIGETFSSNGGVSFGAAKIGVDVPNFRRPDGVYPYGSDSSQIAKTNDMGDVAMLYDPSNQKYWMMGITGGGLSTVRYNPDTADVVLYTRGKGVDAEWTEWENPNCTSTDHWEKRSLKWDILNQLGITTGAQAGSGFLQGPGHGMVTQFGSSDGTTIPVGTLVFPVQYFINGSKVGAIYSKDHGQHWTATQYSTEGSSPQENCVMELDDGSWYMSAKAGVRSAQNGRVNFFRTTNYSTWTYVGEYGPVPCQQGSCIRLGKGSDGKGRYALCHTTDPDAATRAKVAVMFGVDTTSDGNPTVAAKGITWDFDNKIMLYYENTGFKGYNSMCMVDDHTLGILYEAQGHIYFTRIDVSDKVVPPAQ